MRLFGLVGALVGTHLLPLHYQAPDAGRFCYIGLKGVCAGASVRQYMAVNGTMLGECVECHGQFSCDLTSLLQDLDLMRGDRLSFNVQLLFLPTNSHQDLWYFRPRALRPYETPFHLT